MDESAALEGLVAVDFGVGMAAARVAQILSEAGANVTRIAPPTGDPFVAVYPAYTVWRQMEAVEPAPVSPERQSALLANADICILGGEDFPGFSPAFPDPEALATDFPRLIILNITGYPSDVDRDGHRAVDLLVQARTGLVFEQYSDRPLLMSFEPANYGAALQGLIGVLAALFERESSGRGQIVSASLWDGAVTYGSYLWRDVERPSPVTSNVIPIDPMPLILRCSDGKYVQCVLGSIGSKAKMYRAFGLDPSGVDPNDNGLAGPGASPREFFGNLDLFQGEAVKLTRDEVLAALRKEGLPGDAVLAPGECWADPQIELGGRIKTNARGERYVGLPMAARWLDAPPRPASAPGTGPLAGLRVLDLGAFVAGPNGLTLLADLGADVIKVEPLSGDPNRVSFPSFTSANRGKRSIAIDMKSKEGQKLVHRLCSEADVAASNFRTGVSSRLGIDPATLHKIKPGLIVLESSAFGPTGPKSGDPGFDPIVQAFCGLEHHAGGIGNPPLWNRTINVDYTGGLLTALSVLLAVYRRVKTGQGAEVNAPLVNSGLFLASDLVQSVNGAFRGASPLNRQQTGRHPAECIYATKDGWVAIAARDQASATRLAKVLDLSGRVPMERAAWGETEHDAIAACLKQRSTAEILSGLNSHDVWAEECRRGAFLEWLRSAELLERRVVWYYDHPEFGRLRSFGPLVAFSRSKLGKIERAPDLGAHGREILAQHGYDTMAIDGFVAKSVIRLI